MSTECTKLQNTCAPIETIAVSKTEAQEQSDVVRYLTRAGVLFCAVPNGGYRRQSEARSLSRQGVRRGVPDLLVFSPPPSLPSTVRGVALEMKRAKGGRISPEQHAWSSALRSCGWHVIVAHGADEAIDALRACGYGT